MIDVGINASRNRAGGAMVHLNGLLSVEPRQFGINKVHVWSYQKLLKALPDNSWIVKHSPPELEQSLRHQIWWERNALPVLAEEANCSVLLNTDAGSVCGFHPSVVMSRDMLSFEKREMGRYGFTPGRARLIALKYIQTRSMRRADGVIFLTRYAAENVQKVTGKISHYQVIPHGIGEAFKNVIVSRDWPDGPDAEIRCVYVSNALPYKHQWHVIEAIGQLRDAGRNVSLLLIGGGCGRAQQRLETAIERFDPLGKFVRQMGFTEHHRLPELVANSDLILFASSCENMPNTLVEGMATGKPIASSDRGPMPEVLQDGGVYFDPEKPALIAEAVTRILDSPDLRRSIATRARVLSQQYSWKRCASETWQYLHDIATQSS